MYAILLLLSLLLATVAHAQTDPRTLPTLAASQIAYLGSFTAPKNTIPNASEPDRLEYGGYALSLGPDGKSLFIGCHDWGDKLARITIPAVGGGASVVEPCTAIPNWQNIANAQGRVNGLVVGGSLWYQGALLVNGYTFYDNTGGHLATTFKGATIGTLAGPWKLSATWPGMFAGNMAAVPAEWRALVGGPVLAGLCCISTIGRSSFGPAMFSFDPANVGGSNASTWLVGYPEAHKTLGPYDSAGEYYGMAMTMGGLGWVPGTRSPFAVVNRPTTYCYGEGTTNKALHQQPNGKGQIYCWDPFGDNSNGYHSESYELSLVVYDGNDLAAAKAGTKQPWEVVPTARIVLPGGVLAKELRSATFDPATGRLYVAMEYGPNPRIHVWQIGAPVVTPPPAPVDCAGTWGAWTRQANSESACSAAGSRTFLESRLFTVTTSPANGGAACPASPESRTSTETCNPPIVMETRSCYVTSVGASYADGDIRLTVRCDTNGPSASFPKGTTFAITVPKK